ncbi:TetM/TetW/TetO/TetS family tetracycline resistance ribosomal protection protein [Kribbella sandramycini]|uniref:Ribosomal protection tetracycline resistance protein n=1 Tax=Kribbella sandramycini TaxID=60450 RepID=A0A7Y4L6L9_9ACTN|nr:TetM/TetW/TetO/TetS family tetracycline resistance ribosomal protection protein [Kribbella sandramycini]MBB6571631.1 ribosomal protection tetracycline resistance protein [Kribbella sandramycini]NOL44276.1 TetM/TetW/TetO/TetS family tetracycline resistance ribosomal protection protein [Kribbella sandramycini]
MGIVAHVDAGKTSLTERLLYAAGVIDRVGRVDDGNTQTDSMELERRRGITIRSAVVAFELGDLSVNLIDTPGHADFIAEVERALSVLDGAVLVLSAVEGVQAQTRLLMRTLRRLGIPTLIFVNKIDRVGARDVGLLADIDRLLTPNAVPMGVVAGLGARAARFVARQPELGEFLAERNDAFLQRYLDDGLAPGDYVDELRRQVGAGLAHPVYFGSAMTGIGVPELIDGIRTWLPRPTAVADQPLQAKVFKVERVAAGQKLASARIYAGRLTERSYVDVHTADRAYQARPSGIEVYERGVRRTASCAEAGQIVALRGLKDVRIGDQLGVPTSDVPELFARPTLETVVTARDRGRLFQALTQLAEQDPLIQVRRADDITVRLYGEVQKEVIASLLDSEYGLHAEFSPTTPIYIEHLNGIGESRREMGAPSNLWAAGIGFRVAPHDEGLAYELAVELGGLPRAFHTAIEETIRQTLHQGLYGWEIPNIHIILTHTAYSSVATTAADFRRLVPPVLLEAVNQAGTTVREPINHFTLDIPPETLPQVLTLLADHRATPTHITPTHLEGTLPAAHTAPLETALPAQTHGEALLTTTFHTHHPTRPPYPTTPRTDGNPLNPAEYQTHLNGLR